jgi:hypothetical protein
LVSKFKTVGLVLDKKIKRCHKLSEEKLDDVCARWECSSRKSQAELA